MTVNVTKNQFILTNYKTQFFQDKTKGTFKISKTINQRKVFKMTVLSHCVLDKNVVHFQFKSVVGFKGPFAFGSYFIRSAGK